MQPALHAGCSAGAPVEEEGVSPAGLHGRAALCALGPLRPAHPDRREREHRLAALLRRRPALSDAPIKMHESAHLDTWGFPEACEPW